MIGAVAFAFVLQVGGASDPAIGLTEFQQRVARSHPVAQTAVLSARRAAIAVSVARGAFDPTLSAILEQKRFKGIGYYDELEVRALVPTPFGVDFKLGWERADGQIINPERATPLNGLLTASVVLPLGRRIVTDERRTALKQATAAADAADAERTQVTLALLTASARAFGLWYDAEARARIAREGEALAEFRLGAVRSRIVAGDAAAIDSIEARLEVRSRRVARVDAENDALAARTAAQVFIWDDALAPEVRPATLSAIPSPPADEVVATRLAALVGAHPTVRRAEARLREVTAGRALARQGLLPDARVELGALNAGRAANDLFALGATDENYKVSGSLSQSLLLLKERSRLGMAELGVDIGDWEVALARRQVEAGIQIALAEWRTLSETRGLQAESVADAEALLAGEVRRFEAGESSLLIVNLRERALIAERNTLARIEGRLIAAAASFAQATGDGR